MIGEELAMLMKKETYFSTLRDHGIISSLLTAVVLGIQLFHCDLGRSGPTSQPTVTTI